MIYENESELVPKLDIDISLSSIERVILSPWIHPDLSDHVNETIRSIRGCSKLSIVRSTLIGNKEWKRLGKDAV
ncbi:MAG: hypothetical protein E3K32_03500 [wastewater metagenome]|nr:hypothetical protein [Candidatus Loosdrechtia aerotolerans]